MADGPWLRVGSSTRSLDMAVVFSGVSTSDRTRGVTGRVARPVRRFEVRPV
nr:hypothetical protein [Kibdelosporangium sp. MJ126-NF4]